MFLQSMGFYGAGSYILRTASHVQLFSGAKVEMEGRRKMQFLIRAYDGEGKLDRRMEVRPRHLEGMKRIKRTYRMRRRSFRRGRKDERLCASYGFWKPQGA